MHKKLVFAMIVLMGVLVTTACSDKKAEPTPDSNQINTVTEQDEQTQPEDDIEQPTDIEETSPVGEKTESVSVDDIEVPVETPAQDTELKPETKEETDEFRELRKAAWDSLGADKETVEGDWKEAKVSSAKVIDIPFLLKVEEIDVTDVYKVTFYTNQDELLGPIGIYLHPYTKSIIGYDVRH